MREPLANWNGRSMPLAEVMVPALDRAFLFGDAVYEAVRIYSGRPYLWTEHRARLERSLAEVRIVTDVDRLEARLFETLRASEVAEGLAYLQVTRGAGKRAHAWPDGMVPNELIWVSHYDGDPYSQARKVGIAVVTQPDLRWGRCDVKSVNLLANVMACRAAAEEGAAEAVLIDADGMVTEATHSSFFAVVAGELRTMPFGPEILPGITRELVLGMAAELGVPCRQTALRREELAIADELFLSGTSIEVMPIATLDGRPVAGGTPGPITCRLRDAYQARLADWLAT